MKQPKLIVEELLKPAIDDLQVASMTLHAGNGLDRLAKARRELFVVCRKVLVEAGASPEYLLKFDKTFPAD